MSKKIKFIAIDCETAIHRNVCCEICAIGLSIVYHSGEIENKYYLIKPAENKYCPRMQEIHKITPDMTLDAPTFPEVWDEIGHLFSNNIIVAHNAESAEMTYFSKLLHNYEIPIPTFKYVCTKKMSKDLYDIGSLEDICCEFSIDIGTHHNAGDDAYSCAMLLTKTLEENSDLCLNYCIHSYGGVFNEEYVYNKLQNSKQRAESNKQTYSFNRIKAAEVEVCVDKFDETNYFYNKHICITGTVNNWDRAKFFFNLKSLGAICEDCVKKNLDILVIGNAAGKGKINKAKEYIEKGCNIEIMDQDSFLKIYNNQ